jgi:hypothetical protein
MGNDSSGTSIHRLCSAKVLDTHLLNNIYASKLSDRQFNQEMQRGQRPDENPQQYVRDMVKKAYKIAHTNQATQQYLCSQIYEGFLSQWKKALFLTFQGPIKKVYNDLDTLSKEVCYFYKMHVQSGGFASIAQTRPISRQPANNNQPRNTQNNNGYYQSPVPTVTHTRAIAPPALSRRSRGPTTSDNGLTLGGTMSMTQFDNLAGYVCKGGSLYRMGRGRNFFSCLCLSAGHTYEYCEQHNGFVEGGQPVIRDPRSRTPGGGPLLLTNQSPHQ